GVQCGRNAVLVHPPTSTTAPRPRKVPAEHRLQLRYGTVIFSPQPRRRKIDRITILRLVNIDFQIKLIIQHRAGIKIRNLLGQE
ncbi:hypothetical protein, partial [Novosphingobium capsulatum]|uniref:hypothetical protein n=1 Tax=Novosphingobium capsulatum TaxID=13688 RepID=UPI00286C6668